MGAPESVPFPPVATLLGCALALISSVSTTPDQKPQLQPSDLIQRLDHLLMKLRRQHPALLSENDWEIAFHLIPEMKKYSRSEDMEKFARMLLDPEKDH